MMRLLVHKSKLLIALSSLLILTNYYYIYFYEFKQGTSGAGGLFSLIRFFAIGLLISQLYQPIILTTYKKWHLYLIIFCFTGGTITLAKSMVLDTTAGMMVANILICAIPATMLKPHPETQRFWFFLDCCKNILSLEVIIDYAVYLANASIWENKAFIGGVGNPSSFGITCCIFLAYTLFCKPRTSINLAAGSLLAFGALKTNALLPTLLLATMILCSLIIRPSKSVLAISLLFIGALITIPNSVTDGHTAYKLESLIEAGAGETSSNISQSVSLRETIHRDYLDKITEHPIITTLVGDINQPYVGVDSQVLTYLSSFGVLTSLFFLLYTVNFGVTSLQLHGRQRYFMLAAVAVYSTTFIFNRILDYYPMALFFILLAQLATIERTKLQVDNRIPTPANPCD